ncbi:putative ATP-dependent RNA helicase kurz [Aphelenchoides bicaudatus]|nr:putative ATP-dependent RNA helicase kurz [Aphelenchoides bicaudatus]
MLYCNFIELDLLLNNSMSKKRTNNSSLDYIVEDGSVSKASAKKKKQNAEESRIVTASGQKLNLKKSQKIKELRKKREEKVTKNRKRQLKQIAERKVKRQTRAELIASLQEYQLDGSAQTQLQPTVERKPRKWTDEAKTAVKFPKKLRAVSGQAINEATKPKTHEIHYDTGSSCTESEDEEALNAQKEVNEQNQLDDREDVANAKQPKIDKAQLTTQQKFYQLLSTIKGVNVKVARLKEVDKQRSKLPIYLEEQGIVETINDNTVTIISGETGSGKTTQVPQFLYEAGYTSNGHLIGVTEPRRVAAMSMSERVGIELNDPGCSSYQIRFEGNRTDKTKILFMTDGVLLKELQADVKLSRFSAIVIDEAHERSMNSDILIGLLSRICLQRAKEGIPLKLVIMSATLRLTDFMQPRLFPETMPKLISVDSRQFPVAIHFERRTPDDYMKAAFQKACKIHERLPDGAMLIFVSGQKEVHRLIRLLSQKYPQPAIEKKRKNKKAAIEEEEEIDPEIDFDQIEKDEKLLLDLDDVDAADCADRFDDEKANDDEFDLNDQQPNKSTNKKNVPLYCLPLYSMMPSFLQRRVFEPIPNGQRLCVVATNVAETSLTIPNIRYVVDSGKEKRREFDPITGVSLFNVSWISQASANQRSGRAGRVISGHAYRLYSSAVFEDFAKFPPPEILHKPADQMVLHLKSMNIRKITNFPFPTPPEADQVAKSEERLQRLGALSIKNNEDVSSITSLGKTLLIFPLAPHFAKILFMSIQNNVLPFVVNLVSALSVREPLINVASLEGSDNMETQNLMTMLLKQRKRWNAFGQGKRLGDLNVLLNALNEVGKQETMDRATVTKFGLRFEAVKEIKKMRRQLVHIINSTPSLKALVDQHLKQELSEDFTDLKPSDAQLSKIRYSFLVSQNRLLDALKVNNCQKVLTKLNNSREYVFIDPTSTLYKEEPEYVLYQDILQISERKLMQNVSEVESEWLTSGLIKGAVKWASLAEKKQHEKK